MSLTNQEQRQLAQIESALIEESPRLKKLFASAAAHGRIRLGAGRRWAWPVIVTAAVGTALFVLGLVLGPPALALAGLAVGSMSPVAPRAWSATRRKLTHRHGSGRSR
jgi:hypothetical protein